MFKKHRPITIRLDPNGPTSDSPESRRRLQRIAEFYEEFELLFAQIEPRLEKAATTPSLEGTPGATTSHRKPR